MDNFTPWFTSASTKLCAVNWVNSPWLPWLVLTIKPTVRFLKGIDCVASLQRDGSSVCQNAAAVRIYQCGQVHKATGMRM